MNSLSWLLYLADVVGDLNDLSKLTLVASLFALLAAGTSFLVATSDDEKSLAKDLGYLSKIFCWVAVVAMVLVVVVPSSKTIYLIAASESGEYVATSERSQRILDKIEGVLDDYLEEEPND